MNKNKLEENFNPRDPIYRKVQDLPQSERRNYVDMPDEGFVRKQNLDYEKILLAGDQQDGLEINPSDLAHAEALMVNRIRKRTADEIENFNINQEGLVAHGSPIKKLRKILINGLGYSSQETNLPDPKRTVWLNVIGAKVAKWVYGVPGRGEDGGTFTKDGEEITKVGFGKGRMLFGGECILLSELIKDIWPNYLKSIISSTGSPIEGELKIYFDPSGISNKNVGKNISVESPPLDNPIQHPDFPLVEPSKLDPNYVEESPNKEIANILGAVPESKSKDGQRYYPGGFNNERAAFRNLFGHWAFNAIVIPDKNRMLRQERELTEALEEIIKIQNETLPKEEHIPIYDERGKCLYNPKK